MNQPKLCHELTWQNPSSVVCHLRTPIILHSPTQRTFLHNCNDFIPQQRSSAQNSSGVHWCKRRVKFNEVPEEAPKVPEKEALVQSQVISLQQGSWEGSGEGLGGFGAESGQVQQGFGEGFRRRVPEKVPEKVWEALVQSQVRFNRIPEKGSGEGAGGAEPG